MRNIFLTFGFCPTELEESICAKRQKKTVISTDDEKMLNFNVSASPRNILKNGCKTVHFP